MNVWNITTLAPSQSCPNKKIYYNSNEEMNVWLHKKIEPNKMLKLKWTMMFELAWNQYHRDYKFTLKNLENKKYVQIFKK